MTKKDLDQVPDFQKLKEDPRFKALVDYLRSTPKAARYSKADHERDSFVHKAGEFQGWFDCIQEIEEAFSETIKQDGKPAEKPAPYTYV